MSEKVHTAFHVGGIYSKTMGADTYTGVLLGSSEKHNGRRTGDIYVPGHTVSAVVEGGEELDVWTLRAAAPSSQVLGQIPVVFALVEQLDKRVKALEKERK